jgi:chemotaxis protein histidine kinase CheA
MEAWAELGFSNQLPFESVSEMGMNHLERDGHHIALEYRPVYVGENKDLEKIIVVATDISHEVALKEQAKAEQDLVQLAISVMRDRSSFVDYVFEIRRIFALVVSELEKPPIAIDLPNLFRWIHTIKGGLSSYHMNKMARRAHLLEDLLGGCRDSNQGISQGLREESLVSVQDFRQSFEAFIVEN